MGAAVCVELSNCNGMSYARSYVRASPTAVALSRKEVAPQNNKLRQSLTWITSTSVYGCYNEVSRLPTGAPDSLHDGKPFLVL